MKLKRSRKVLALGLLALTSVTAAGVGGTSVFAESASPGHYLTPEQVHAPVEFTDASGRVTFRLEVVADDGNCYFNESNGFPFGDNNSEDGVVCGRGDGRYGVGTEKGLSSIKYRLSYNVAPGDAVDVDFFVKGKKKGFNGSETTWYEDPSTFADFCRGGTGYPHTGEVRGDRCTLHFPRASKAFSKDGGVFTTTRNISGNGSELSYQVGQRLPEGGEKSSEYTPNPIKVVEYPVFAPSIINSKPFEFKKVDGKWYAVSTFQARGTALSFAYPLKGVDRSAHVRVDETIGFDSLPDSAEIVPLDDKMTVQGKTVLYRNEDTTGKYNYADLNRNSRESSFEVRIPVDSMEPDKDYKVIPRIVRADNTIAAGDNTVFPVGTPAYLKKANEFPGKGEPQGFDVSSVPYGWKPSQGQPNSVVAEDSVRVRPNGQIFKDIRLDENGAPGELIEKGDGNTWEHSKDIKFWDVFGQVSSPAHLRDAAYCNHIDIQRQRIDPSRPVSAQRWDGSKMVAATDVVVKYGHMEDTPGNQDYRKVVSYCSNPDVQWSDTPSADSNLVLVTFPGDMPGDGPADQAVQQVQVPMVFAPGIDTLNPLSAFEDVYDQVIGKNNGQWVDNVTAWEQTRARWAAVDTWMRPEKGNFTANAGTSPDLGIAWPIQGAVYGDSVTAKPSYKLKFGPGLASVDFDDFIKSRFSIETVHKADFGADGLPLTADDGEGWEFVLHPKPTYSVTYRGSSSGERLFYQHIHGVVPAYAKTGQTVSLSAEYLPTEKEKSLRENPSNNTVTATLTVSASPLIGQSKIALNTTERVGTDIAWSLVSFNTTTKDGGSYTSTDFIPVDGDENGTKLAAPLSNIRVHNNVNVEDMSLKITKSSKADVKANNAVWEDWQFDKALPEGTVAIRTVENNVEAGATHPVTVTASTKGSADGDVVKNRLEPAQVADLPQPVPATPVVTTNLVDTSLHGTVFYDSNKDGHLDPSEPRRFPGATVTVTTDDGTVVGTAVTDEKGEYNVPSIPFGNYHVTITDRGGNIVESFDPTSPGTVDSSVTRSNPHVDHVDFGFASNKVAHLTVKKSILNPKDSYGDGETVTYKLVVDNDGETRVTHIGNSDDQISQGFDCPKTVLEPKESMTCTVTAPIHTTQRGDASEDATTY